jgi:hypothetical protein
VPSSGWNFSSVFTCSGLNGAFLLRRAPGCRRWPPRQPRGPRKVVVRGDRSKAAEGAAPSIAPPSRALHVMPDRGSSGGWVNDAIR